MFYIYQINGDITEYCFLTKSKTDKSTTIFSANFHSLEQLCDVGLDDVEKKLIPEFNQSFEAVHETILSYGDVEFLFTTPTLDYDYIIENYPEYLL